MRKMNSQNEKKKFYRTTRFKIVVILFFLLSCIPIKQELKDGGSIRYQAILYSVTKVHELPIEPDGEYITGIRVCILGIPIFDNAN